MDHKLEFKPKARLLLQLGDQLIRSESIALLEVIKNSYDANATRVDISLKNVEHPEQGEIIIEDDGDGMDEAIIRDVWMQPGSDYKAKMIKALDKKRKSKDSKRIPIGEKGIGRFGVHKLGYSIELTSKKSGEKEVRVEINWKDFEKDTFLKDIKIKLTEEDKPRHFINGKTGTRIVIRQLKGNWSRGTIRDLYRAVTSLNSPFESGDSFKTYFKLDNQDWLKGLVTFKDIESHALYYAEAIIEGDRIKTLKYKFRPWDTMTKLKERIHIQENIKIVEEEIDDKTRKKKQIPVDLSKYKIGQLKLKLLIFDKSGKILSLGVTDKKGFKEYLDINGGIRVFRNDIRVYDYGEPRNDWLNLDLMRVNQPGKTISNNIIIGAVSLDRMESRDLEEKTNREGFIENEAYRLFVSAIRFTLDKMLTQRNLDKEKVRKFYGSSAASQPVIGHLKTLQEKISGKVKDTVLKEDLLKSITDIEKDYKTINEIYTRSSSAGLSLSIVIHEIVHMISELAAAVEQKPVGSHIRQLVKTLQKTVGDYAGVIKQSRKSKAKLVNVVSQALSNIQYRMKAHNVEIIRNYENKGNLKTEVSCAPNLVISTIINLIDNSIWWQNYADVKKKKIFIDIIADPKNYLSILIADNGPGFTIPTEEAVKPFISDKPGGMGLGLHLASEVLNGQKGRLIFPDKYDCEMPEEFQKGAKLLLAFRKML